MSNLHTLASLVILMVKDHSLVLVEIHQYLRLLKMFTTGYFNWLKIANQCQGKYIYVLDWLLCKGQPKKCQVALCLRQPNMHFLFNILDLMKKIPRISTIYNVELHSIETFANVYLLIDWEPLYLIQVISQSVLLFAAFFSRSIPEVHNILIRIVD